MLVGKTVETTSKNVRHPDVQVLLGDTSGSDGNAFMIMGRVEGALKLAGYDDKAYHEEARKGTYEDLIRVTRRWVRTYETVQVEDSNVPHVDVEAGESLQAVTA